MFGFVAGFSQEERERRSVEVMVEKVASVQMKEMREALEVMHAGVQKRMEVDHARSMELVEVRHALEIKREVELVEVRVTSEVSSTVREETEQEWREKVRRMKEEWENRVKREFLFPDFERYYFLFLSDDTHVFTFTSVTFGFSKNSR